MNQQNPNHVTSNIQHQAIMSFDDDLAWLRASMKQRLSPQSQEKPSSPAGARELRGLLHRLVEIDVESRELLKRVFLLLGEDERLKKYLKDRIEDPRVSRMWQLVEQLLASQEDHSNFDDLVMNNGVTSKSSVTNKGTKSIEVEKDKPTLERFKVKTLGAGGGVLK